MPMSGGHLLHHAHVSGLRWMDTSLKSRMAYSIGDVYTDRLCVLLIQSIIRRYAMVWGGGTRPLVALPCSLVGNNLKDKRKHFIKCVINFSPVRFQLPTKTTSFILHRLLRNDRHLPFYRQTLKESRW